MPNTRTTAEVEIALAAASAQLTIAQDRLANPLPNDYMRAVQHGVDAAEATVAAYEWVLGMRGMPLKGGRITLPPGPDDRMMLKAQFAGEDANEQHPEYETWDSNVGLAIEWVRGLLDEAPLAA